MVAGVAVRQGCVILSFTLRYEELLPDLHDLPADQLFYEPASRSMQQASEACTQHATQAQPEAATAQQQQPAGTCSQHATQAQPEVATAQQQQQQQQGLQSQSSRSGVEPCPECVQLQPDQPQVQAIRSAVLHWLRASGLAQRLRQDAIVNVQVSCWTKFC